MSKAQVILICLCKSEHSAPEEGHVEGVLLPRKQLQFLAGLPTLGLIISVLQALFSTSCLVPPPPPQPAASCGAT